MGTRVENEFIKSRRAKWERLTRANVVKTATPPKPEPPEVVEVDAKEAKKKYKKKVKANDVPAFLKPYLPLIFRKYDTSIEEIMNLPPDVIRRLIQEMEEEYGLSGRHIR